jgi:ribosomal protection tetracycline resistance protein
LTSTLNLGILAHVDAGKTSLTERLLYAAGVIGAVGSVDDGNTQTDTLALERQRGITIKAAVVSFQIGDVVVNLIDTPGHPDFIAEVERVLGVLDGAVLVVSAVEGVQAQTRVLMRALERLRTPTLLFVNKVDRGGAQPERVLHQIVEKLTSAVVPMGTVRDPGTRAAAFVPFDLADDALSADLIERLADHDDALLAAWVDGPAPPPERLVAALAGQTRRALVHPVFFGSAITGTGVGDLERGIAELLPSPIGEADGPLSAAVFKIERGAGGEKIAYARLFSGSLRTRDRVRLADEGDDADGRKVTAVGVFEDGVVVRRPVVSAGRIAKLWGLHDARVGDVLGRPRDGVDVHRFAPPTLEAAVVPSSPADKGALHAALAQLAEQDPLINLRQDDLRGELYVSLYGEVQKEVVQATLAADYGLEVGFSGTTPICVERPGGVGAALELLGKGGNPFCATVGLRVEPAAAGSGVSFRVEAPLEGIPLYVFRSVDEFARAMEETVRETLGQGLHGWQVVDCAVVLTQAGYVSPSSKASDYRKLTPLVLMAALAEASTVVCEPIHRLRWEVPVDVLGGAAALLGRLDGVPQAHAVRGLVAILEGEIAAARLHELQQRVPGLTRGEGALESEFAGYRPVGGAPPTRPRTDRNPSNRQEYLLHVLRRA